MNRKWLFGCFASAGLNLLPAAGLLAGGDTAGAAAAASAASSADSGDVNGAAFPAGVSAEWWEKAEAAIRQLQDLYGEVPTPFRARPSWKAEVNQKGAHFGNSVGTAGDVNGDGYDDVIVGAYQYGQHYVGGAFGYYGSASGLSTTADWTAEGDVDSGELGRSVGTAGDVNGDGYDDVIVGAWGVLSTGGAFAYYGSALGLSITADWTAESAVEWDGFGVSVGTAGDVNGDGYDDVIVGAYRYTNGQHSEGRALVYYGSASGLSATADWTAESDQPDAHFGNSVGTAGDVNGDGYDDVVVGAVGRAFVYFGSASGLSATADWTAGSDQGDGSFGASVGTAGDVNGDGYDDVAVGASRYDINGRVFVYYGSASGLSTTANWTAENDEAGEGFGNSVGTAGDVNGDGYDDVIVGADLYDNGQTNEGAAFVYFGSASGLASTANWTAESDKAGVHLGSSVGTAGDVNGDGYDDWIGGGPESDHPEHNEGMAGVFHGRAPTTP